MRQRLLQYLACPSCGGGFELCDVVASDGSHVMEGALGCATCEARFRITRGIPRFADVGTLDADKAATAANFGWQWQHFTQEDQKYADQFLGWIAPVTQEFFKDKIVLEGGCGKGRHTQLVGAWGAEEVIGADLSDAVETAFAATRHLDNAH